MARMAILLALALWGCEENPTAPRNGPSRIYFTFAGTISDISEPRPGRAEKLGIKTGDSVYYVFAVDTLRVGFNADLEGIHPRNDSLDRPGGRPFWFFDSLMSIPLNGPLPPEPAWLATYYYQGYRVEQSSGYAGTFLTNDFSMMDSILHVSICFNGLIGGPTLPEIGTRVSGSEQFYDNVDGTPNVISTDLEVIAIGSSPVFRPAARE